MRMMLPAPVLNGTILRMPHDCILNPAATVQSARNYHAMLAARALGRLSGQLQGASATSRCDAAAAALSALLTPALAAKLGSLDPKPLLMHLNSSLLNPQVGQPPGLLSEERTLTMLEKSPKARLGALCLAFFAGHHRDPLWLPVMQGRLQEPILCLCKILVSS